MIVVALRDHLEAFQRSPSQATFNACLTELKTAALYIGVTPVPSGWGSQVRVNHHPQTGPYLSAFLEPEAAVDWWKSEGVVVAQRTTSAALLEVAAFEGAQHLVIEPHVDQRTLALTREQCEQLAKAWGTRWLPRAS